MSDSITATIKRLREIKQQKQQIIQARSAKKLTNFPMSAAQFDKIIDYKPRPLQRKIDSELKRFNSILVHRRFGKTLMEIRRNMLLAAFCPFEDGNYVYAGARYKDVKK